MNYFAHCCAVRLLTQGLVLSSDVCFD